MRQIRTGSGIDPSPADARGRVPWVVHRRLERHSVLTSRAIVAADPPADTTTRAPRQPATVSQLEVEYNLQGRLSFEGTYSEIIIKTLATIQRNIFCRPLCSYSFNLPSFARTDSRGVGLTEPDHSWEQDVMPSCQRVPLFSQ